LSLERDLLLTGGLDLLEAGHFASPRQSIHGLLGMFSALADAAESEGSYDHSGSDDKECGHVFMEIVMMFGFSLELPCLSVISSVSFLLEAGGVLHLLQHLLLRSSFFPVLRATFLFGRA